MGYIEQGSVLLEAPCIFCGYRGANYWQRGTHPEGCPWHLVDGGIEARRERLGTIVRALYRAQVLGSLDETMRRESPAGEDVKDMGESEAKAPETADQPVESAARRQPGTKYEAVAQASRVAHHYIVPPPRDLSLIRFALHGLMERAYWLANAAAQDKSGRYFKPGAAEAFLKDAKDAEALLGRLTSCAS